MREPVRVIVDIEIAGEFDREAVVSDPLLILRKTSLKVVK